MSDLQTNSLRRDGRSRGGYKILIYLLAVLAFSGSVSGSLYLWFSPAIAQYIEFGAFSFRLTEVLAIAGTIPLLMSLGLGGKSAWGLHHNSFWRIDLTQGLLLGIASLSVTCVLLLIFNLRVVRPDLITEFGHWFNVIIVSALSATLIALIEEIWFRGALQTVFTRVWGTFGGITVTAAFYAVAHFLRPSSDLNEQPVSAWSGFDAIASGFGNLQFVQMQDSLVALFFAGVVLGILRARQGSIVMCIGVHIGWVFVIKVYKKYTYINPQAEWNALVGHYDGVMGWLSAVLLVLLALTLWYTPRLMRSRQT